MRRRCSLNDPAWAAKSRMYTVIQGIPPQANAMHYRVQYELHRAMALARVRAV